MRTKNCLAQLLNLKNETLQHPRIQFGRLQPLMMAGVPASNTTIPTCADFNIMRRDIPKGCFKLVHSSSPLVQKGLVGNELL